MARFHRPGRTGDRRGNYAILMTVSLIIPLGFGALAVDASYIRLAQNQAQDIADASSQAALFMLRRTGDQDLAQAAAEAVIARNRVGGQAPELTEIEFGTWNYNTNPGSFESTTLNPNAVRVRVERSGDNALGLFLARVLGFDEVDVGREAVSATRNLQVVLVMDITGSWGESDFSYARQASLAFWDVLSASYSDYDQVGMTVFTNRFGWEYTPMTYVVDAVDDGQLEADWSVLNIASKAGKDTNPYDNKSCSVHSGSKLNNFSDPLGGCYPDMPREYSDEPGTDHTTGIIMARTMFQENDDPAAYRAMIVLTDGKPNGYGKIGTLRDADGYEEERWREYARGSAHTSNSIKSESISLTQELWEDHQVNTWVVSFVASEAFLEDMVRGDGYYARTTNPAYLVEIFDDIANSLPLAIVR